MLTPPPSSKSKNRFDDDFLHELDEIDRENNNYMQSDKLQDADQQLTNRKDPSKRVYTLSTESSPSKPRTLSDLKRNFQMGDIMDFVHHGLETIVDDQVTKRFTTEELTVWNLLSRTNQQYEYVSFRVTVLWMLGFMLRYCILFPFR